MPYRYQQEFKAAQSDARAQERGLWSPNACGPEAKAAGQVDD
jgi:endonuclease YncB( thermonuclease family)